MDGSQVRTVSWEPELRGVADAKRMRTETRVREWDC